MAKVSVPLRFLRAARADFDEAYDFYERQASGLGERFADHVQFVLDRIAANPRLHAVVLKNVRKAVVAKFPYCVYYREEANCIRILSVFHASRDPAIWKRRMANGTDVSGES